MNRLAYIRRYLTYLLQAKTKYYLHSPFVYHLMSEVIQDDRHFYAFDEIDALRSSLLKSKKIIRVKDMGAGSNKMGLDRRIGDIAKYASANAKKGKLLFNLANHYQCKHILELGTSLGLSTAYMAKADSNIKLTTVEACPITVQEAQANFEALYLDNIHLINDTFENAIPTLLNKKETFDLIYFDGNHQKEATLKYFSQLLSLKNSNSIFVFDDINWSAGMYEAWISIVDHPDVSVTVDLFKMGLVFFKKDQAKQHFRLYF